MTKGCHRVKISWITVGAIFGGLSVALGAFAAHGLKDAWASHPERLAWFETGAKYQMYHALAIVLVGLLALHSPTWCTKLAGFAFSIGILLFSGSLYLLAATEVRVLGAITPFGGVAFLIGWGALAVAGTKASKHIG